MLSRAEQKRFHSLRQRKNRDRDRRFLAEGLRVVEELLAAGIEVELAAISSSLEDSERGRRLADTLARHGPVRSVGDAELNRLAATETPQGIVVMAVQPEFGWPRRTDGPEVEEAGFGAIEDREERGRERRASLPRQAVRERRPWLVLDAVQDPGNFGTLVRIADAFGAAGVVVLPGTVDPWNPKSVRAAAGSSFRVPILSVDPSEAFERLRGLGARILAADASGRPMRLEDRKRVSALVVGNEGAGVSDAVRDAADAVVGVPMPGRAESLNVAVAAGILLYELTRET